MFRKEKQLFILYIFVLFSVGYRERYAYNERANFCAYYGKPYSVKSEQFGENKDESNLKNERSQK